MEMSDERTRVSAPVFPGHCLLGSDRFKQRSETYGVVNVQVHFNPGETTANFRQRMIATTQQRGDWNYFGTHTCIFEQTRVTGGALRPREGVIRDDVLLYMPVELIGKLVDIDPAGIYSQLFFDALSIGVAGQAHLRAVPRRRMSSRWLNFRRNLSRLPIAGRAATSLAGRVPEGDTTAPTHRGVAAPCRVGRSLARPASAQSHAPHLYVSHAVLPEWFP